MVLLDPVQYPGAIKAFAREVCRNDLLNFGCAPSHSKSYRTPKWSCLFGKFSPAKLYSEIAVLWRYLCIVPPCVDWRVGLLTIGVRVCVCVCICVCGCVVCVACAPFRLLSAGKVVEDVWGLGVQAAALLLPGLEAGSGPQHRQNTQGNTFTVLLCNTVSAANADT